MKSMKRSKVLTWHNELKSRYGLEQLFTRNPKLEKYVVDKVHKPILEVLSKADNPTSSDMRKALRLYKRIENFLKEASYPVERTPSRVNAVIDRETFDSNMKRRLVVYKNAITSAVPSLVASGLLAKVVHDSGPNPYNVGALAVFGGLGTFDLYLGIRARAANPIGIKLKKADVKDEEFEAFVDLMNHHYLVLRETLRKWIKDIEKDKNNKHT